MTDTIFFNLLVGDLLLPSYKFGTVEFRPFFPGFNGVYLSFPFVTPFLLAEVVASFSLFSQNPLCFLGSKMWQIFKSLVLCLYGGTDSNISLKNQKTYLFIK